MSIASLPSTGSLKPEARMEIEANAHLIAAAPELLQEARLLTTAIMEWRKTGKPALNMIVIAHDGLLAAIAKAEGRA